METGKPQPTSASLDLARDQWRITRGNLAVAISSADSEEALRDPQALRRWLQAVMGMCDSMKAASAAYSSAVGYENRGK